MSLYFIGGVFFVILGKTLTHATLPMYYSRR